MAILRCFLLHHSNIQVRLSAGRYPCVYWCAQLDALVVVIKGVLNLVTFPKATVQDELGIASYTSLIAAADLAGDEETKRACEQILQPG
jgi:hypothetical protein